MNPHCFDAGDPSTWPPGGERVLVYWVEAEAWMPAVLAWPDASDPESPWHTDGGFYISATHWLPMPPKPEVGSPSDQQVLP